MLPKKWRLSREEFQIVRKDGALKSGQYVGILVMKTPSSDGLKALSEVEGAKAGLIVSKKLLAHAVDRNMLKRKIRAALQLVLPTLHSPLWFVVLPNRKAKGATVAEMAKDIKEILNEKMNE